MEQRFKALQDVKDVEISEISKYVELPPALRNHPIFEKVEMCMPLFGVEEQGKYSFDCGFIILTVEGVGVIDCPGTKENSLMSVQAIQAAQKASIIIFVFRTETGLDREVRKSTSWWI